MAQWIVNGVQLGWLIDGDDQCVYVYRKGRRAAARRHVREIAGEGPVAGFVLNLAPNLGRALITRSRRAGGPGTKRRRLQAVRLAPVQGARSPIGSAPPEYKASSPVR